MTFVDQSQWLIDQSGLPAPAAGGDGGRVLGFIAFIIVVQGFGSAIASIFLDGDGAGFLMRWSADYQPYAGIATGIAGLGVAVLADRFKKPS